MLVIYRFIFIAAHKVGRIKLKNQVEIEANKTGIGASPAKPSIATAIDSRTTIFPKNNEGLSVTAIKTSAINANNSIEKNPEKA